MVAAASPVDELLLLYSSALCRTNPKTRLGRFRDTSDPAKCKYPPPLMARMNVRPPILNPQQPRKMVRPGFEPETSRAHITDVRRT